MSEKEQVPRPLKHAGKGIINDANGIWIADVHVSVEMADELVLAANCRPALMAALELVQRGIRSGHVNDASIVPPAPPGATEADLTSLSEIVDAALAAAKGGAA